ncbi:unnamed protein product [Rhizoctonia solani]|uniref:DNA cross-link repair 1A protein n=1 Tax=Rhizoctonia solani TaxID=456999 RepID=A0A8H3BLD5_9AGAM|nr:unnamed protein product [Rhizoctonia solani]CAE6458516.1 unnamed protein product [Rhizoctonia solani]
MPSPESSHKRKQSVSAGEPHTLSSFFGSKRVKRDSSILEVSAPTSGVRKADLELPDVIVISDDDDCAPTSRAEDIIDLSFSDPVDHGLQADEDDLIEDTDASDVGFTPINGSSKCLGNQLLIDSVELGTCSICGLLLLDWTKKEINEHVSECLAKPTQRASGSLGQACSGIPSSTTFFGKISGSRSDTPNKPNPLNTLMSSRQEKEAWDAMDAANNAKRGTKTHKPEGKRKVSIGTKGSSKGRKKAPFYKVMPGMPIAVDAFCYGKLPGVTAYFLSHAHSDHYTNLSSSWKNGPIYCSLTTGNLIKHMLRVDPQWVKPLPDNQAIEIPDTGGVRVTLIDANHCPGSSLFVFSGKHTIDAGDSPVKSSFVGSDRQFTYLHCGDFRACPAHTLHPAIHGKRLDTVYLDTTYLNPKYCFPPQAMVIDACAELAKRYVQDDKTSQDQSNKQKSLQTLLMSPAGKGGWFRPSPKMQVQMQTGASSNFPSTRDLDNLGKRVLVVVGTYTIGKERVLKVIAKALSSKIYCNSRKHAVFMCQTDADLHAMLTKDSTAAQVHVLPLGQINIEGLSEYLKLHQTQYDRILGFRPTGWTYTPPVGQNMAPTVDQILAQARAQKYDATDLRPQRGSNPRVTIYGVPYSEHSSFRELTCFALSVDWGRMIATVNVGSAESRQKMQTWFEKWGKSRRDRSGAMVEYRCADYW